MKKFLIGLGCGLLALLAIPLIACGKSTAPDYKRFDSFSKYKNFDKNVVAIDVRWDACGYFDEFTVTDTEQVNEIVTLFKNATMKKCEGLPDGANGGVSFVYGDGTKVGAGMYIIYDNGTYYHYENGAISDYISNLRDNRAN